MTCTGLMWVNFIARWSATLAQSGNFIGRRLCAPQNMGEDDVQKYSGSYSIRATHQAAD